MGYRQSETHRIRWEKPEQHEIARATADLLKNWDAHDDFDTKLMMKAFRTVVPLVMEPHKQRHVGGPSQVPWLKGLVEQALKKPAPEPIPVPTPIPIDTSDLLLDAVTTLENSVTEMRNHLDRQSEQLDSLLAELARTRGEVRGLTDIIVKRRERKRLKPPDALPIKEAYKPVKTLKVIVVGVLRGTQRDFISRSIKGLCNNMDVIFEEGHQGATQLPYFDQLIVMHWMSQGWKTKALHSFPSRCTIAHNPSDVINLIGKFGENPR